MPPIVTNKKRTKSTEKVEKVTSSAKLPNYAPKKLGKKKNKTTDKTVRRTDHFDILDGRVRIFRYERSGDIWQMQFYVPDEKKYMRKSLRTSDRETAMKIAENDYIFYRAKTLSGEKLFSLTAEELRDKYLEFIDKLVESNQLSKGRKTNIKTFTKTYLEFVGKQTRIQNIPKEKFEEYIFFRQKKKKDITMTVVLNESITIKQMYKWGVKKGYLSQNNFPEFGTIHVRKNEVRRDSFSIKDYKHLIAVARLWYLKVPESHPRKDEEIYYRRTIRDFIVLIANYGFRPQELRYLKYKDVRIQSPKNKKRPNELNGIVTVRYDTTKVRTQREVIGRRGEVFERRKNYSPYVEPDDYVFSHYRKKDVITKENLYPYYNALIAEVKKQHPDYDDSLTLYSLRHFFITIHLIANKIDIYKLARYTGTSMFQIQKHYDHMKDSQVSKELLSYRLNFSDDNEIILDDDVNEK
jgi:hypothetical protein